jgi:hypothetical protein
LVGQSRERRSSPADATSLTFCIRLWIEQHPTAQGLQSHLQRMFSLAIAKRYYQGKILPPGRITSSMCCRRPRISAASWPRCGTQPRPYGLRPARHQKPLKPKARGGRQRENIAIAQEKALLARFATAAGAGELLNIHDLKHAYEQAIGHPASNSTVYNLLGRHGVSPCRESCLSSMEPAITSATNSRSV